MTLVYVNGKLVAEQDAVVSAFDHGLVVGDGVFETVLLDAGRPFALRRHLERLERSASGLGIEIPRPAEIRSAVADVVRASGYERGRIRITVTAGNGPLGSARLASSPTLVVAIAPEAGSGTCSSVVVVPWRRNERGALAGLKTTSYGENVVALAYAHDRGADEAIFANTRDELCEGTGSNVFLVRDGRLVTPPLTSGCLAGITRALVLEHVGAVEEDLDLADLDPSHIEEAFLTSSIRGIQPIAAIDGAHLAECPGPVTQKTIALYRDLLATNAEP
jgi:branched-chain amino acid aminotransferase